ncbi:MAG: hypothetical protein M1831_004885 [Alyxoria varia]|nr:MAG: hypothetical protein M1831_004885 [Alyxoria varia]
MSETNDTNILAHNEREKLAKWDRCMRYSDTTITPAHDAQGRVIRRERRKARKMRWANAGMDAYMRYADPETSTSITQPRGDGKDSGRAMKWRVPGDPGGCYSREWQLDRKRRLRQQLLRAKWYLGFNDVRDHPVTLISIDIEVWELDELALTQIGVSIFHTGHITNSNDTTDQILDKINGQHLIVEENSHRVNTTRVRGCPDSFNFGKSTSISVNDIEPFLRTLFDLYTREVTDDFGVRRSIRPILIGHSVEYDMKHLRQSLGLDIVPLVGDILDTQELGQSARRDLNRMRLRSMLDDYGVEAANLRNGGNDAWYAMLLLLKLVEKECRDPTSLEDWTIAWKQTCAIRGAKERTVLTQAVKARHHYESWDVTEEDIKEAAGLEEALRRW